MAAFDSAALRIGYDLAARLFDRLAVEAPTRPASPARATARASAWPTT